ncbi:MupA/Atu3671 family FMN-dependent luciferase-like monooxygenase [Fodinicola acaciae]|uniref:MupA/Atu3671 family FMN-dependent luciferase-like monooxygenase n=1 Tax=Fodinicola acaciae TaxID=2681555 RepID=UPI0013D2FD72|nr:MupA/Atu3671 family FMN-dependent luciferase-like monooxygenase [Fodinicola acaciae]
MSDRRKLLAARLRAQLAEPTHPLSYPQQRLWFLDQLAPEAAVYNVPLDYQIDGPLDVVALTDALNAVIARHDILRTVYRGKDGVPEQVVRAVQPIELPVVDLSGQPESAAEEHATQAAASPFDLEKDPVLRATLLRLAPQRHRLLLTVHHIACDGPSLEVLGREISALYRGETLPELAVQYGDFARLVGEFDQSVGYWRRRLDNVEDIPALPTDRPRPPVATYRGQAISFEIPAVDAIARQTGTTRFTVLLAAFAVLLGRYTGGDEVVVGTPVANRDRVEFEPLIGYFANTLVLRLATEGGTFADLVQKTGDLVRQALAHADVPFELLVDRLHPGRDLSRNPLFGVLFSYRDDDSTGWSLPGCRVRARAGDSGTAKVDLSLSIAADRARLEFSTDLFDRETAVRLAEQYVTVVTAAIAAPDTLVSELPVLPATEVADLLAAGTGAPIGPLAPLHDQIARQAAATPDAFAVTSGDRRLTYAELDCAAEKLARRLAGAGAGPGTVVGILLDRSVDLPIALLGVLRAGAAYLPLDPAYPADRLAMVAEDAAVPLVVSGGRLLRRAARLATVIDVADAGETSATPRPSTLDDAAYLIYTSGSTGRPKGVAVTHRNLASFAAGMDDLLGADDPGVWLALTSMSFDISILELLWTLARGFEVVVRATEPTRGQREPVRPVDFSLFYFGNAADGASADPDPYRLLREGATFADRNGFTAVWTPERHFHRFGGLYPNPSVIGGMLAGITENIAIRAGSVVLPLHDPLRVAEEWSLVDNLSGGRVGISFASGWNPRDFVLAPDAYEDRKDVMLRGIEEVRRLWRGETVRRGDTEVGTYPRPVQPELPVWVTSARHPDTFRLAGELGAGLLTHLLGHGIDELADKIEIYRKAWAGAGHPGEGRVAVMVHTFVGPSTQKARGPLADYLRTSWDLLSGFSGAQGDLRSLPAAELDALVDRAVGRFTETAALIGTPEKVADTVAGLAAIGVDEVACLIDFGLAADDVLAGLESLAEVPALLAQRTEEPVSDQLGRHRVTHLQCTPTLARMLCADPRTAVALRPLQRLLVGGEALPADLADALVSTVDGSVHNMYGPTEATIWATTGSSAAIGRPLAGVSTYVVDSRLRLVPTGAPGELLIGGPYVAAGYRGQPGLTASRFVPDPFSGEPGGRLYRTGDRVRWHDGELEFLGRLDDQVKLHGYRIELGEIEAALQAHPAISAGAAGIRGEQLVVWYVGAAEPDELRTHLTAFLPAAMVPSRYVRLDQLPRTPNGKLDRGALPDRKQVARTSPVEPESERERLVAAVWCDVLGVDHVGGADSFFDIGGNSLLAVRVRARLVEQHGLAVSLVDIFRYPTVRALAAALGSSAPALRVESDRRNAAVRAGAARRNAARASARELP